MPKKEIKFRHLDRYNREAPAIIDAHQIKPIVKRMGLEGKSVEEKIVELVGMGTMAHGFERPGMREGEYTSTYALIPLHTDEGTCRHRTSMFSALLEAAGINHMVEQGIHPYVHITLKNERVMVDYTVEGDENALANIEITGKEKQTGWKVRGGGVEYIQPRGGIEGEELVPERMLKHPDFGKGMNRALLEKMIKNKELKLKRFEETKRLRKEK